MPFTIEKKNNIRLKRTPELILSYIQDNIAAAVPKNISIQYR